MSFVSRKKKVLAVFSFLCVAFALTFLVYAFAPEFRSKFFRSPSQRDALNVLPDYAVGEVLVVFRKGVNLSAVRSIAEKSFDLLNVKNPIMIGRDNVNKKTRSAMGWFSLSFNCITQSFFLRLTKKMTKEAAPGGILSQ